MGKEQVLVIEDDPTMRRVLKDNFAFDGFEVRAACDGEEGLEALFAKPPDLIILDIMLPKVNGYEICRLVREQGLDMPIIMLTAKGQEADIVLVLNLGADDYVTKPFSIKELMARANAFLRRRREPAATEIPFGEWVLSLDSRILRRNGVQTDLTPKEFGVLALLAGASGRAFTRDEILNKVWGYSVFVTPRSVDRCVNTLRHKIEPDPRFPIYVQTVREIGYRFHAPS